MLNYKKIIVIGCSGAGKSTFSRKLHKATGIELFHLDAMYWNKDGTHITREELIQKQKEIFKKDSFIIDGNYKGTIELRIAEADLIFFFDLPKEVCIEGVKIRKGNRPEISFELPDDEEFLEFIKNFNADVKPWILELFEKYNKKVITFHSRKEADEYMEKISPVDLTLNTGKGLFNHRVAAVIVQNNKLLAQKNTKTNEYYLVGGRVRFGESSEEALVREVKEELDITLTDYKPLWINECFFVDDGRKFHEICMYYLVDISNTDFNNYETVFETKEENRLNTYEWLDIDRLGNYVLYPQFIKDEINNTNRELKLIITKEY